MIESVEMLNWRASDRRIVHFQPGITFLMGANGVGKTSILEAIIYGLTGEASTVKDRTKLLRDPARDAAVRLTLAVGDERYVVERSQTPTRAGDARLILAGSNKTIATSHRNVTQNLERLMGVSADFLQRIVYMAEGDVFRFLSQPPGKALDLQIRRVLGINQMDEFLEGLKLAKREIADRTKALQQVLGDLERLGVGDSAAFAAKSQAIETQRERLAANLRTFQEHIAKLRSQQEDLGRVRPLVERLEVVCREDPKLNQAARTSSVLQMYSSLDRQQTEAQNRVRQVREDIARLNGELAAHQRVLDILMPLGSKTDIVACPVCGKPMTSHERQGVLRDLHGNLERVQARLRELEASLAEAEFGQQRLAQQSDDWRMLRNWLVHSSTGSSFHEYKLPELYRWCQERDKEFHSENAALNDKTQSLTQETGRLDTQLADYLVLSRRLRDLKVTTPDDARAALVDLEIRSLTLRAAEEATAQVLTTLRNVDMESIYAQVARMWGIFSDQNMRQVRLDSAGLPVLENQDGREFDLSQFSGGEKTALLLMLHTIIAQYFSNSDFLLIDEPLEHLDPVNRRSLVRFLVSAHRRGSFRQAIVATFEESLLRKYMSEEGVNILHV